MITIPIPEWIQWGALALAMVYAVPKALRAAVVALVYVACLAWRYWPMRVRGESGDARLFMYSATGRSVQVLIDIVGWALGERPVFVPNELDTATDAPEFAPGDVVTLRSGGPAMTVSDTERRPDGSTVVNVDWFHGKHFQERGGTLLHN